MKSSYTCQHPNGMIYNCPANDEKFYLLRKASKITDYLQIYLELESNLVSVSLYHQIDVGLVLNKSDTFILYE